MKTLFLTLTFACGALWLRAADPISLGVALNLAGRQQLLVQRMITDHLMQGLAIENTKVSQQLSITIIQFEENLRLLQTFSPNANVRKIVDQQQDGWTSLRALLLDPPTQARITALIQAEEALLDVCGQGTAAIRHYALQQQSKGKLSQQSWVEMVSFADQQRNFTQRLAMLYLCQIYDPANQLIINLYSTTLSSFRSNTGRMLTFEGNTPEIEDHLKEFILSWGSLKKTYEAGVDSEQLGSLFSLTNNMCQGLERVMTLYANM